MQCRSSLLARCTTAQTRPGSLSSVGVRPCNGCSGLCAGKSAGSGCSRKPAPAVPMTVKPSPRQKIAAPPEAVGLYYSTATGKTQEVADIIKDIFGDDINEPVDIGDLDDLSVLTDSSLDGLIVGAPTWNTGADEGRSGTAWDEVMDKIKGLNLKGRKVAVFGCGDQHGYGDYFCDAMEELHSNFAAAGADMVGKWPTVGYEHSYSKAEIEEGVFCGLALDQDNQDDLTEQRIKKWGAQVLQEMGLKTTVAA